MMPNTVILACSCSFATPNSSTRSRSRCSSLFRVGRVSVGGMYCSSHVESILHPDFEGSSNPQPVTAPGRSPGLCDERLNTGPLRPRACNPLSRACALNRLNCLKEKLFNPFLASAARMLNLLPLCGNSLIGLACFTVFRANRLGSFFRGSEVSVALVGRQRLEMPITQPPAKLCRGIEELPRFNQGVMIFSSGRASSKYIKLTLPLAALQNISRCVLIVPSHVPALFDLAKPSLCFPRWSRMAI